jgi:DNA ligase (NAD+)
LDAELVGNFDDLFTLTLGDALALPRFAKKSAENLITSIEKARTITLGKLLTALSIDHVGEEIAHDLADAFGSIEGVRTMLFENFSVVYGVGEVVAKSLADWFADSHNSALLDRLLQYVTVKNSEKKNRRGVFAGLTIVLTGTLAALSRDEAKARIRREDGEISESVSSKTSILVAGENAGSKLAKAKSLGLKVINERELLRMLK